MIFIKVEYFSYGVEDFALYLPKGFNNDDNHINNLF